MGRGRPGRGAGPALHLLHTGQTPTRAALGAELGVSRALVGAMVKELEALGLVRVDDRCGSAAAGVPGRPSHRLEVLTDGPVVLAAHASAGAVRAALVGLGGRIVARAPRRVADPDYGTEVADAVTAAGIALLRDTSRRCVGVGIAVPSDFRGPAAHAQWRAALDQRGLPSVPPPCFVGTDTALAALAEHRHGAGRQARHLLYLTTSQSLAEGALVTDGRLHTGHGGRGVALGHLPVSPGGRRCLCGVRGCLASELDPMVFLARAGAVPPAGASPLRLAREVLRGAGGHHSRAGEATRVLVDHLGQGLTALVRILDPDRIVLAGFPGMLLDARPAELRAAMARHGLRRRAPLMVLPSVRRPELVGAAEIAWQPILDDPPSVLIASDVGKSGPGLPARAAQPPISKP